MAIYTNEQLLEYVNEAIVGALTSGVEVSIDGQNLKTATLHQLQTFRTKLINEIAQAANGGFVQSFFQGRMSRGRC